LLSAKYLALGKVQVSGSAYTQHALLKPGWRSTGNHWKLRRNGCHMRCCKTSTPHVKMRCGTVQPSTMNQSRPYYLLHFFERYIEIAKKYEQMYIL
jgi:hypothetical protein